MIKHFCDGCGYEITGKLHTCNGPDDAAWENTIVPLAWPQIQHLCEECSLIVRAINAAQALHKLIQFACCRVWSKEDPMHSCVNRIIKGEHGSSQ